MAYEFAVLQAARMKGRLSPELAAASCGINVDVAGTVLGDLGQRGLVHGEPSVRLTSQGRARLAELVEDERRRIDTPALSRFYHEFDSHNSELKAIISDWQLRAGEPNDHSDESYDRGVLDRLTALDGGFQPLLTRIIDLAPRLDPYRRRFAAALRTIAAGDTAYVARPIADSYHTVWFEFHEELIGLLGLSREQEAAAGRAV